VAVTGSARSRVWGIAAGAAGVAIFAALAAWLDPELLPRRPPRELTEQDRVAIRETLRAYQKVYQDFFASGGGPALLDEFPASKDVKHHVFRDVGFLGASGLVLVQDLATLTVVAMRSTGQGLAEADAYEEWNYVLQEVEGRKPVGPLKGMGQGFRYVLHRSDSGWRVVQWDLSDVPPPSAEEPEP
jgi:hypothetical protein